MRHLYYTNYQSGLSGLSNGIMSVEVGVALAFLTNRFLLLDGNVSPPANVVQYGDRVDNRNPSRITDLIDLPVAWGEPADFADDLAGARSRELTPLDLADIAIRFPADLDIESDDAIAFANGRKSWVTVDGELDAVPVLRLTEEGAGEGGGNRRNLSFYSSLFYLDDETRASTYQMLARMQPKAELTALAERVVADLGSFNAVHLRRGDFKVTYGVTTLDRQPWQAIEAMDHHFRRDDLLVIVTDERDDPFFEDIRSTYPRHVFIDHHILDEYTADFGALPHRDSLCLAYLSQLVAAHSRDFIGTMTSTFTSIIQRYRGNRGLDEPFKFLWNELPEAGAKVERGSHPISECVPLDRGVMIEEGEGPYSWNRYNPLINPAWMREWPESFLLPETMATGALPTRLGTVGAAAGRRESTSLRSSEAFHVAFENLQVEIGTNDAEVGAALRSSFEPVLADTPGNVIAHVAVDSRGGLHTVVLDGDRSDSVRRFEEVSDLVKRALVGIYNRARRNHVWLRGVTLHREGHAVVVAGDAAEVLGARKEGLVTSLRWGGWDILADEVVPVRAADALALPFGSSHRFHIGAQRPAAAPLAGMVIARQQLQHRDALMVLAPSVAVAQLIRWCLDFEVDRHRSVERLCRLVESRPVAQLSVSDPDRAAELLSDQVDAWARERLSTGEIRSESA